jgi:hypothetical protein
MINHVTAGLLAECAAELVPLLRRHAAEAERAPEIVGSAIGQATFHRDAIIQRFERRMRTGGAAIVA